MLSDSKKEELTATLTRGIQEGFQSSFLVSMAQWFDGFAEEIRACEVEFGGISENEVFKCWLIDLPEFNVQDPSTFPFHSDHKR
jgi:hypothetical protein